jgi:hypothetical protein
MTTPRCAVALRQHLPHGRATGWCEGCLRTLDEIAVWSGWTTPTSAVWARCHRAARGPAQPDNVAPPGPGTRTPSDAMKRVDLLVRRHLAVRLPGLRAPAAGAGGLQLRGRLPAGAVGRPAAAPWGQKGPAEIEPKRAWTFRQVHWLAQQHGIAMDTPLQHPFNPLPLLRLATGLRHAQPAHRGGDLPPRVAAGGADAVDPAAGRAAGRAGAGARPGRRGRGQGRAEARTPTRPSPAGLFGVPSFEVDGRLFWGLDALPMLADALRATPGSTARPGKPRLLESHAGLLTKISSSGSWCRSAPASCLPTLLNNIKLGGYPLGFWFAHQGSIYIFIALDFLLRQEDGRHRPSVRRARRRS